MKPLFLNICLAIGLAQAATLPYQGLATDAKGNPKADASFPVGFALYSAPTGGSALWSESQSVATKKGLFSTTLGSVATIPDSLFKGTALYLGVSFDGGSEGGRVLLGSTVWAKTADTAKVALHVIGADSVALRSVRDTVTSLKATISGQFTTITSLTNSVDALQSLLLTSNNGIAWNSATNYGYLKDSRDGQVYRTVVIGAQTWMAQNLNFAKSSGSTGADTGVCYSNSVDSCAKYGRLYTWAQSLGLNDTCNTKSCAALVAVKQKGLCPTGWHVPSDAEWTTMQNIVDAGNNTDGMKLKSSSGWSPNTGTDAFGFRALPGGDLMPDGFHAAGINAFFWSSTEYNALTAMARNLNSGNETLSRFEYISKTLGFSARCLKN
jgi:uncharacterized protein (TIGR02145 family)